MKRHHSCFDPILTQNNTLSNKKQRVRVSSPELCIKGANLNYTQELTEARKKSSAEFHAQNDLYLPLIEAIRKTIPRAVLAIESDCSISEYTQGLLASFVRTHFVAIELIQNSELEEAVTLGRKQLELLARLWELEEIPIDKLIKKTPKVSRLKTKLNEQYGSYSEAAHSSTYAAKSLLGFYKDHKRANHVLFPEFTTNTEIIFENWVQIFFEFTLWVLAFKKRNIENYSATNDEAEFRAVHKKFKETGLHSKLKS